MAAATADRDAQRQPGELVPYAGSSGYKYYKNTMVMKDATGAIIRPMVQGAGASNARFLGVAANNVDRTLNYGSSQATLNIWKRGEFMFEANGTGTSAHIGQRAYALDDQTVGVSAATPVVYVGEITGLVTTGKYRVLIDQAVNAQFVSGLSGAASQN